jgi:hypothetical protein
MTNSLTKIASLNGISLGVNFWQIDYFLNLLRLVAITYSKVYPVAGLQNGIR